jgi:hypothetical protein
MGKRRNVRERSTRRSGDAGAIQPGDILTIDDILGTDPDLVRNLPPAGWLRGEASPFPFDVFDCRAFALTSVAMASAEDIAGSFSRQRRSDGREYINRLPEREVFVDFDLAVKLGGFIMREGPLFKAQQMEDKWDIYQYSGYFYFVRSWTGNLVHVARGEVRQGVLHVDSFATASGLLDSRDKFFFLREITFLLINHVVGAVFPHPIPSYRAGDDDAIMLFSFSEFGRRGWYGTLQGAAGVTDTQAS